MLQKTEATSPLSTFTTSRSMDGWLWKILAKFHFRSSSILSGTGRYLFHLQSYIDFCQNFQSSVSIWISVFQLQRYNNFCHNFQFSVSIWISLRCWRRGCCAWETDTGKVMRSLIKGVLLTLKFRWQLVETLIIFSPRWRRNSILNCRLWERDWSAAFQTWPTSCCPTQVYIAYII